MTKITGTVKVFRTYFLEDVAAEIGDIPRDNVHEEVYENVDAHGAVRILRSEGVRFDATGQDWAADPDGSFIVNYATAERCETTATLDGYPVRLLNAIMDRVDAR